MPQPELPAILVDKLHGRDPEPVRILFVCLGNICRSPMAEAMMIHKVQSAFGLPDIEVDSAGIGDWHVGQSPDRRTLDLLQRKGIARGSNARQIKPGDFAQFDLVIGMDEANRRDLLRLTDWRVGINEEDPSKRVSLALEWADPHAHPGRIEVPDPYYGGTKDFEEVYTLLDASLNGLIGRLQAEYRA